MYEHHTLGRIKVRAGEILTFTYDESIPEKKRHVTVVALSDIDLSDEMATFCESVNRSSRDIFTEEALPGFIQYLTEKRLLHIGNEVRIHFGSMRRPAARLMDEYRFKLNPESFWEAKLLHRYESNSFTVFNHQNHLLTVMAGIDSPFIAMASMIDLQGELLGMLRLSVLSDHRHTLIDDNDIERLRLALQADISLHVDEIAVLVTEVKIISNPDFGINAFKRHMAPPLSSNPISSTHDTGKLDEHVHAISEAPPDHAQSRSEQPRGADEPQWDQAGSAATA